MSQLATNQLVNKKNLRIYNEQVVVEYTFFIKSIVIQKVPRERNPSVDIA